MRDDTKTKMTGQQAFEILLKYACTPGLSDEIYEALSVARDHTLRMEQTLGLILSAVNSADADRPEFAITQMAPDWTRRRRRP